MGFLGTMPPVSASPTLTANDTSPTMTPGTMLLHKHSNGAVSLIRYMKADNATVKQHLCVKYASNSQTAIVECANGDMGQPGHFAGVAAGTIASNKYGWVYCGNYVPGVSMSTSVATNDLLILSASGGKVRTFDFNATMATNATSTLGCIGKAKGSASDTTGSIQIYGVYL